MAIVAGEPPKGESMSSQTNPPLSREAERTQPQPQPDTSNLNSTSDILKAQGRG